MGFRAAIGAFHVFICMGFPLFRMQGCLLELINVSGRHSAGSNYSRFECKSVWLLVLSAVLLASVELLKILVIFVACHIVFSSDCNFSKVHIVAICGCLAEYFNLVRPPEIIRE